MSVAYDNYISEHRKNVAKGYAWMLDKMYDIIEEGMDKSSTWIFDFYSHILNDHDRSKDDAEEYIPYDNYFYGKEGKTKEVKEAFDKAWLRHIHRNPHHWQHWILVNDDSNEGIKCIEIPFPYIIEMICDWWSFSWKSGDLNEIFDWYNDRKGYIKFHPNTKKIVEDILGRMKEELKEDDYD